MHPSAARKEVFVLAKRAQSASFSRLPKYLAYLKVRQKQGVSSISSTKIAEDMRLHPVQVRKDLALATSAGRPKTGYPVDALIEDLERFLGFGNASEAFLIGAGRLGLALLGHAQFAEYGLSILAAFDTDPALHGKEVGGKPIFPLEKLENLVGRMRVRIGILAVPAAEAQAVCDRLGACGIRAIWNFSSPNLKAPPDVILQNEDLAASFAVLSNKLAGAQKQERLEGGTHA